MQVEALPTQQPSLFEQLFERLGGEWHIDRRIVCPSPDGDEHIGRIEGRLTGVAYFDPVENGVLAYREEGRLRLRGGAAVKAVRRYRYRLDDDALLIEFADGPDAGRRFLRLDAVDDEDDAEEGGEHPSRPGNGWRVADNHLCGRDLYQAEYRFEGFDQTARAGEKIVQRTAVNGPRKDYAIVTVLRRLQHADRSGVAI